MRKVFYLPIFLLIVIIALAAFITNCDRKLKTVEGAFIVDTLATGPIVPLKPNGEIYVGNESQGVSGHSLGDHLSACSMMYVASGDKRFKQKVDYIVNELDECKYALHDSLEKEVYAFVPYLRILPNGNTLLSYQSIQFRNGKHDVHNAEMVVAVGDAKV